MKICNSPRYCDLEIGEKAIDAESLQVSEAFCVEKAPLSGAGKYNQSGDLPYE